MYEHTAAACVHLLTRGRYVLASQLTSAPTSGARRCRSREQVASQPGGRAGVKVDVLYGGGCVRACVPI